MSHTYHYFFVMKTFTVYSLSNFQVYNIIKLISTQNRLVVARDREWGVGRMDKGGSKGTNFQL